MPSRPILLALIFLTFPPSASSGEKRIDWITVSGDITQIALPLAAAIQTKYTAPEQLASYATRFARLSIQLFALKSLIREQRPHKQGFQSFPSGHTAAAFFGAAELGSMHPRYALPAMALACWTGYSRVYGQYHYLHDVLAGAALGYLNQQWSLHHHHIALSANPHSITVTKNLASFNTSR